MLCGIALGRTVKGSPLQFSESAAKFIIKGCEKLSFFSSSSSREVYCILQLYCELSQSLFAYLYFPNILVNRPFSLKFKCLDYCSGRIKLFKLFTFWNVQALCKLTTAKKEHYYYANSWLILKTSQCVSLDHIRRKTFVFVVLFGSKVLLFGALQRLLIPELIMKSFGISNHVSDHDYLPDDESSSDDCSGATAAKDNELKTGKSKSSDNEFVFDKEWAFRRKCSLQSLLSARLLTSSYEPKICKKLELTRHLAGHRRSEWFIKEITTSRDTEKPSKGPVCFGQSKKKQSDTSECKSHTNESLKSLHRSNTV